MSCSASTSNDDFNAMFACFLSVREHEVRCAVGRDYFFFVGKAKLVEDFGGFLHGSPVRFGAHDDRDNWFHIFSLKIFDTFFKWRGRYDTESGGLGKGGGLWGWRII